MVLTYYVFYYFGLDSKLKKKIFGIAEESGVRNFRIDIPIRFVFAKIYF